MTIRHSLVDSLENCKKLKNLTFKKVLLDSEVKSALLDKLKSLETFDVLDLDKKDKEAANEINKIIKK